ncbi:MAG: nitroreductase family protein, partial [Terriglobia bacterium]
GSVLEAARWAPSSYNEQPWAFIVATKDNKEEYEPLLGCLVPGNQSWAKQAPVLMLSVASLKFKRNGKPNRHAFHDVGLAVANLVTQATALGLFVHQMAGIEPEKARATYEIPDGWEAVTGIALGYLGEAATLPEKMASAERAPRTRKPLAEFVFSGRWNQPLPLL